MAALTGVGILSFCAGVYHYFLYVVPGSAVELHARLLNAVMGAPLHFFTSTDTGTTTNRYAIICTLSLSQILIYRADSAKTCQ